MDRGYCGLTTWIFGHRLAAMQHSSLLHNPSQPDRSQDSEGEAPSKEPLCHSFPKRLCLILVGSGETKAVQLDITASQILQLNANKAFLRI